MATLILPHEIEPFTPANATEVDQNYDRITEWINTELVLRDGSQAMTGRLTLSANPTQPMHAVPKQYIDALIPIGTIWPYGGMSSPGGGWVTCNGQQLAIADYPDLYAVLQGRYGTATAGMFKVPDFRGRVMIGLDGSQTRFNQSGDTGGTWVTPLPQHHHSMVHDHGVFDSGGMSSNHQHSITHNHGAVETGAAGGHSHQGAYYNTAATETNGSARFTGYSTAEGVSHATVTDTKPDHKHGIDLPQYTGDSGVAKTGHFHSVNVPKFTGDTADTGVTGVAAEHLPPYQVVFFIIKGK